MELLFIWIDKFRNIDNKGYNLSNQFDISYNKPENKVEVKTIDGIVAVSIAGGKITLSNVPNSLSGFFGEKISNVTAIIGKNSTGKSNVLDFVLTALHTGNRVKLLCDYFLLFRDGNELKFSGRIDRASIRNSTLNCLDIELDKLEPNDKWNSIFF